MSSMLLPTCLLFLIAVQQPSTPSAKTIDIRQIGPKVGERAPDFSLRDQNGELRGLKSVTGPKGLMLVFYRSADW